MSLIFDYEICNVKNFEEINKTEVCNFFYKAIVQNVLKEIHQKGENNEKTI